jgi:hypothetical protein
MCGAVQSALDGTKYSAADSAGLKGSKSPTVPSLRKSIDDSDENGIAGNKGTPDSCQ